jgi:WD40 repeat protein
LALDGAGGIIRIYRLSDGGLARTLLGHTSQVNTLAYSPDGRRLASGSFDKLIKLWDATTGEELLSLRGHEGGVVSLAFTRDGQRLISGGVDWTARIWDARPLGPPNGTPGRAP